MVDVATLTGACVVALGTKWRRVRQHRRPPATGSSTPRSRAGEAMWPLPIPSEMLDKLRSTRRSPTWRTSPASRWGGALAAAAFLGDFVAEGIDWAHLDIAGPGVQRRRPVRLHPQGRHRLRGPHPGGAGRLGQLTVRPLGRTGEPPDSIRRGLPIRHSSGVRPFLLLAGVVLAHRAAGSRRRRRRRTGRPSCWRSCAPTRDRRDAATGPLAVDGDQQQGVIGHRRLAARRIPRRPAASGELSQVRLVGAVRLAHRARPLPATEPLHGSKCPPFPQIHLGTAPRRDPSDSRRPLTR